MIVGALARVNSDVMRFAFDKKFAESVRPSDNFVVILKKGEIMNMRAETAKAALAASMVIGISGAALLGAWAQTQSRGEKQALLRSTIAFVSTRHDAAADPAVDAQRAWLAAEIYLMDGDGTNPRRLTDNTYADGFPSLSPDGARIVFDSNRLRTDGDPFNTSDLFVMNADGTAQTSLVRGSSATWSPDSRKIAFHASASGTGKLINFLPGAATTDSDIFVMDLGDFLKNGVRPKNITNNRERSTTTRTGRPRGRRSFSRVTPLTTLPIIMSPLRFI